MFDTSRLHYQSNSFFYKLDTKLSDKITVYGLKNCDSCRKALRALPNASLIDIRGEVDLTSKVPYWLEQVGANILVNTRSTTWRNLDSREKEVSPSELLVRYPTLVKRPVIESNQKVYVSWSAKVQKALT